MANIKDLKKKIKSTQGTFKITTAMKLVSAAKLSKAQLAITNSRPYSTEVENTIKTVSALVDNYSHEYLLDKSDNKHSILLVISANKGLCGGYNSQLAKTVMSYLNESSEDLKVFFIGKKVKELIDKEVNVGEFYEFEHNEPTLQEIQSIAKELAEQFCNGEVGKIYVAYNIFKSAISFIPTVRQILPFALDDFEKRELKELHPFDFKYSPSANEILDTLIPETYINSLYTCVLDANAAEHGARMSAMESASQNCKDAIRSLTLKMNKLRQAAITTELIEVVSGAESLNNG